MCIVLVIASRYKWGSTAEKEREKERKNEREREREREKEWKREREGYTGSGTALPQGRTPNLGHNYTEADVRLSFLRETGAAVTYTLSRFRNNNYLIPEANGLTERKKERAREKKKEGRPAGPPLICETPLRIAKGILSPLLSFKNISSNNFLKYL